MQRSFKTTLFGSIFIGLILGLLMVAFAWEHNPGCSIHCDNFINWPVLMGYMAFGTITSGGSFLLILHR